ncbi:probable ATP-dependent DNA helicase RecS [Asterias rubens]|uniref:probable ATP-dependent DNA helicase RecS n=1 Tax=Asterias rubens TaxID=7604 RepID=UPI00145501C0|nr:probable ATP-dependent DNA helicase RecS [Asterias rubens]
MEECIPPWLDRVSKLGLEAADITSDIPDHVLEQSPKYSILFASPESLCSSKGKELLLLVKNRCCGLFVDESHCVSKWGHSSTKSSAFRKCYGQLGQLRSILNQSIV